MKYFIYVFSIVLMLAFGVSNAMALNVGYYDMDTGQGNPEQVNSINVAGHTPVNLTDLTGADLANVDVIYVQNPSNGSYGAEYLSRLADIQAAVASGKRLIIHDRYVGDGNGCNDGGTVGGLNSAIQGFGDYIGGVAGSEAILPGGAGFTIIRDFCDDANINIRDNSTLVTNGPGGVLNDASLDGGNSSSHGYSVAASLPANASLILSRGNTDEIVTFSYPYGSGCVVYSTIPLDHYLGGSGPNPPRDNFTLIYAPNVVAYAAEGCGAPDLIVSYLPTATAGKVGGLIRRLSVKYRVMNQGSSDAVASELDFYLSRDTALNVGDVYVGTVNIPALAPGAQAPLPYGVANFLLPVPAPAVGTWKVLGVADANNDNAESDETNNVISAGAVVMGR